MADGSFSHLYPKSSVSTHTAKVVLQTAHARSTTSYGTERWHFAQSHHECHIFLLHLHDHTYMQYVLLTNRKPVSFQIESIEGKQAQCA